MLAHTRSAPDRAVALASYRALAGGYDESCRWLDRIRIAALDLLALRPGDTVFDVACGTGSMLPALARAVGADGHVLGIEQSPEMAAAASRRIEEAGLENVELIVSPVEEASTGRVADALLFCYTHDVLQSDRAIERLLECSRPGARVVVAGARILGWWAAPLNLWKLWRSRHYLTTYRGLRAPWARLAAHCPDLHLHRTYILGTSYLAVGHLRGRCKAPGAGPTKAATESPAPVDG